MHVESTYDCSEKANRTVRFNQTTTATTDGMEMESAKRKSMTVTENVQVEEPSASMLEAMSEDVFDDQLHELFTVEKSKKFADEISAARTPEQVRCWAWE